MALLDVLWGILVEAGAAVLTDRGLRNSQAFVPAVL